MGEDVVDTSGPAEEADAGDGGEDCGCRRSAASECNVFFSARAEVMTEGAAVGSATAAGFAGLVGG